MSLVRDILAQHRGAELEVSVRDLTDEASSHLPLEQQMSRLYFFMASSSFDGPKKLLLDIITPEMRGNGYKFHNKFNLQYFGCNSVLRHDVQVDVLRDIFGKLKEIDPSCLGRSGDALGRILKVGPNDYKPEELQRLYSHLRGI